MSDTERPPASIYDRIGESGFADLVGRFYTKVREDDVIGPMYPPGDWDNAERRLRLFLIQRFGGPGTYSAERGHPRLRMRHMPFPISPGAAERWLVLMRETLVECEKASTIDAQVRAELWPYFVDTATFMINQPTTDGG